MDMVLPIRKLLTSLLLLGILTFTQPSAQAAGTDTNPRYHQQNMSHLDTGAVQFHFQGVDWAYWLLASITINLWMPALHTVPGHISLFGLNHGIRALETTGHLLHHLTPVLLWLLDYSHLASLLINVHTDALYLGQSLWSGVEKVQLPDERNGTAGISPPFLMSAAHNLRIVQDHKGVYHVLVPQYYYHPQSLLLLVQHLDLPQRLKADVAKKLAYFPDMSNKYWNKFRDLLEVVSLKYAGEKLASKLMDWHLAYTWNLPRSEATRWKTPSGAILTIGPYNDDVIKVGAVAAQNPSPHPHYYVPPLKRLEGRTFQDRSTEARATANEIAAPLNEMGMTPDHSLSPFPIAKPDDKRHALQAFFPGDYAVQSPHNGKSEGGRNNGNGADRKHSSSSNSGQIAKKKSGVHGLRSSGRPSGGGGGPPRRNPGDPGKELPKDKVEGHSPSKVPLIPLPEDTPDLSIHIVEKLAKINQNQDKPTVVLYGSQAQRAHMLELYDDAQQQAPRDWDFKITESSVLPVLEALGVPGMVPHISTDSKSEEIEWHDEVTVFEPIANAYTNFFSVNYQLGIKLPEHLSLIVKFKAAAGDSDAYYRSFEVSFVKKSTEHSNKIIDSMDFSIVDSMPKHHAVEFEQIGRMPLLGIPHILEHAQSMIKSKHPSTGKLSSKLARWNNLELHHKKMSIPDREKLDELARSSAEFGKPLARKGVHTAHQIPIVDPRALTPPQPVTQREQYYGPSFWHSTIPSTQQIASLETSCPADATNIADQNQLDFLVNNNDLGLKPVGTEYTFQRGEVVIEALEALGVKVFIYREHRNEKASFPSEVDTADFETLRTKLESMRENPLGYKADNINIGVDVLFPHHLSEDNAMPLIYQTLRQEKYYRSVQACFVYAALKSRECESHLHIIQEIQGIANRWTVFEQEISPRLKDANQKIATALKEIQDRETISQPVAYPQIPYFEWPVPDIETCNTDFEVQPDPALFSHAAALPHLLYHERPVAVIAPFFASVEEQINPSMFNQPATFSQPFSPEWQMTTASSFPETEEQLKASGEVLIASQLESQFLKEVDEMSQNTAEHRLSPDVAAHTPLPAVFAELSGEGIDVCIYNIMVQFNKENPDAKAVLAGGRAVWWHYYHDSQQHERNIKRQVVWEKSGGDWDFWVASTEVADDIISLFRTYAKCEEYMRLFDYIQISPKEGSLKRTKMHFLREKRNKEYPVLVQTVDLLHTPSPEKKAGDSYRNELIPVENTAELIQSIQKYQGHIITRAAKEHVLKKSTQYENKFRRLNNRVAILDDNLRKNTAHQSKQGPQPAAEYTPHSAQATPTKTNKAAQQSARPVVRSYLTAAQTTLTEQVMPRSKTDTEPATTKHLKDGTKVQKHESRKAPAPSTKPSRMTQNQRSSVNYVHTTPKPKETDALKDTDKIQESTPPPESIHKTGLADLADKPAKPTSSKSATESQKTESRKVPPSSPLPPKQTKKQQAKKQRPSASHAPNPKKSGALENTFKIQEPTPPPEVRPSPEDTVALKKTDIKTKKNARKTVRKFADTPEHVQRALEGDHKTVKADLANAPPEKPVPLAPKAQVAKVPVVSPQDAPSELKAAETEMVTEQHETKKEAAGKVQQGAADQAHKIGKTIFATDSADPENTESTEPLTDILQESKENSGSSSSARKNRKKKDLKKAKKKREVYEKMLGTSLPRVELETTLGSYGTSTLYYRLIVDTIISLFQNNQTEKALTLYQELLQTLDAPSPEAAAQDTAERALSDKFKALMQHLTEEQAEMLIICLHRQKETLSDAVLIATHDKTWMNRICALCNKSLTSLHQVLCESCVKHHLSCEKCHDSLRRHICKACLEPLSRGITQLTCPLMSCQSADDRQCGKDAFYYLDSTVKELLKDYKRKYTAQVYKILPDQLLQDSLQIAVAGKKLIALTLLESLFALNGFTEGNLDESQLKLEQFLNGINNPILRVKVLRILDEVLLSNEEWKWIADIIRKHLNTEGYSDTVASIRDLQLTPEEKSQTHLLKTVWIWSADVKLEQSKITVSSDAVESEAPLEVTAENSLADQQPTSPHASDTEEVSEKGPVLPMKNEQLPPAPPDNFVPINSIYDLQLTPDEMLPLGHASIASDPKSQRTKGEFSDAEYTFTAQLQELHAQRVNLGDEVRIKVSLDAIRENRLELSRHRMIPDLSWLLARSMDWSDFDPGLFMALYYARFYEPAFPYLVELMTNPDSPFFQPFTLVKIAAEHQSANYPSYRKYLIADSPLWPGPENLSEGSMKITQLLTIRNKQKRDALSMQYKQDILNSVDIDAGLVAVVDELTPFEEGEKVILVNLLSEASSPEAPALAWILYRFISDKHSEYSWISSTLNKPGIVKETIPYHHLDLMMKVDGYTDRLTHLEAALKGFGGSQGIKQTIYTKTGRNLILFSDVFYQSDKSLLESFSKTQLQPVILEGLGVLNRALAIQSVEKSLSVHTEKLLRAHMKQMAKDDYALHIGAYGDKYTSELLDSLATPEAHCQRLLEAYKITNEPRFLSLLDQLLKTKKYSESAKEAITELKKLGKLEEPGDL
ncbi:MAG: hypothetical protein ACR2PT_00905 [Endozoicomonas sp.]